MVKREEELTEDEKVELRREAVLSHAVICPYCGGPTTPLAYRDRVSWACGRRVHGINNIAGTVQLRAADDDR